MFPAGDVAQLQLPASMETLILWGCEELTGTSNKRSTQVNKPHSSHCYIRLAVPAALSFCLDLSSFLLTSFFMFPAGDVAQLQLPASMKELNLGRCPKLTGTSNKRSMPVNKPHSSHCYIRLAVPAAKPPSASISPPSFLAPCMSPKKYLNMHGMPPQPL